jgi:hypothetical protein
MAVPSGIERAIQYFSRRGERGVEANDALCLYRGDGRGQSGLRADGNRVL